MKRKVLLSVFVIFLILLLVGCGEKEKIKDVEDVTKAFTQSTDSTAGGGGSAGAFPDSIEGLGEQTEETEKDK